MRPSHRWWLVLAGSVAPLIVVVTWVLVAYLHVPHFYEVDPGRLYRSGQPRGLDWRRLRKHYRIRTVVNLRPWEEDDEEWAQEEKSQTAEHGIRLVYIPMRNSEIPTQQQAQQFLEVARDSRNWPVLVHCERGRDRTGVMVALYRMQVQGWPLEKVIAELRRVDDDDPVAEGIREFLSDF